MTSTETQTTKTATRKSPAKKAPAQPAPEKATAAKTAPAKKAAPAAKAPTAPAQRKLRWLVAEGQERAQAGGKDQSASVEGHTYAVTKAGDGWTATHTYEGTATLLVTEGKFAAAYRACVEHNRSR